MQLPLCLPVPPFLVVNESCGASMASLPHARSVVHLTLVSALLLSYLFVVPPSAFAAQTEISAKVLLEPIVEEYGPKYSDVETAVEQLRSGRLRDARDSLAKAQEKNADLPPANMMLAEILLRLRQANLAVAALEEAAREAPDDPAAYAFLGDIALRSRRFTEAGLLLEKSLELCEKYTVNDKQKKRLLLSVYPGLASLAERNGDWDASKKYLEDALQVDRDSSMNMMRYGRVLFKMAKNQDDEEKALRIFQDLYKADPDKTVYPDVNMALLYQQADKGKNAEALMKRAVAKNGSNLRTRLSVAKWALDTNRLDIAKENAEAALELDPSSLEAKLYVGLVGRFTNNLGVAEEMFRSAHEQAPTNLSALTQLCLALVDQPDEAKKKKAFDYAKMNLQMHSDPNQAAGREAAVTYAWVLSRLGKSAEALQLIQNLKPAVGAMSADSAYYAAQILYDSGQNEAARTILEQRLASDAVFPNRDEAEQLLARLRNP